MKHENLITFKARLYDLCNEYKEDVSIEELIGTLYALLQQCKYNYAVVLREETERKTQK